MVWLNVKGYAGLLLLSSLIYLIVSILVLIMVILFVYYFEFEMFITLSLKCFMCLKKLLAFLIV